MPDKRTRSALEWYRKKGPAGWTANVSAQHGEDLVDTILSINDLGRGVRNGRNDCAATRTKDQTRLATRSRMAWANPHGLHHRRASCSRASPAGRVLAWRGLLWGVRRRSGRCYGSGWRGPAGGCGSCGRAGRLPCACARPCGVRREKTLALATGDERCAAAAAGSSVSAKRIDILLSIGMPSAGVAQSVFPTSVNPSPMTNPRSPRVGSLSVRTTTVRPASLTCTGSSSTRR